MSLTRFFSTKGLAILIAISMASHGDTFANRMSYTDVLLKGNIEVSDDIVTLGDLFTDTGEASQIMVADGPQPGGRLALSANQIASFAASHGLLWQNSSKLKRVVVTRTSRVIETSEILKHIARALVEAGAPERVEIQLSDSRLKLHVPEKAAANLDVINLDYDDASGIFEAELKVPNETSQGRMVRISGRAYAALDVPTLIRYVNPGEIIQADDIEWTVLRVNRVSRNAITDQQALLGKTVKRRLAPGKLLRTSDVENPVVVTKGSLVTVVYRTGAMTLTAEGRAMENGGKNDSIRVINTHSNRTLQANVIGPSAVSVSSAQIRLSAY